MGKIDSTNKDIHLSYDESTDVLYVSFGKPQSAKTDPITDADLVRYNPKTAEVVGITIIAYKERYNPPKPNNYNQVLKSIISNLIYQHKLHFA